MADSFTVADIASEFDRDYRRSHSEGSSIADFWADANNVSGDIDNPTVGDVIDNWFTGNLDYKRNMAMQKQAQEFNALEAQKEFERTKALRASAYQDAFKDLQAAGLSPYLLYSLGSGGAAATPGLQSAHSGSGSYRSSALGLRDILTVLASVFGSAFSVGVGAANASKRVAAYNFATKTKEKIANNRLAFDREKWDYFTSSRRK